MSSDHDENKQTTLSPYKRPERFLRLLLVRHGQTDWNVQRRYQGQSDTSLNDFGKSQAAALAARLAAEEQIDFIYSSDLQRTLQTAQAIADALDMPVRPEPGLREVHFGRWEGMLHHEIVDLYPELYTTWLADPDCIPPGGESFSQVTVRLAGVLDQLQEEHPDQTVLIVSHGGALTLLICHALGLPPQMRWKMRLETTSISELHLYEGNALLMRLNDAHHLKGSKA
jgi:alpha-ribazole phosphatase